MYRIRYSWSVDKTEPLNLAAAGRLIRESRSRSGLTQTELATRAGVPRPVLSAYENGRRQPSVAMLAQLVGAAGLTVRVVPRVDVARNGARFVDALGLVDAIPRRHRRRVPLARPVVWSS